MTELSPGPWTADYTWNGVILIKDATGAVIATLEKHASGTPGSGIPADSHAARQTANARVIAGATELLEILEDSVEILNVAIESRETLIDEKDDVMRDLRRRVRSAILKVRPR